MAGSPRSIELSVRIYKILIKAYPASFRREYENEMTLVFREHIAAVLQKRGTVGLTTAWFRLLGDLTWSAPKEHFREMQRRIAMKNAAFALLSVFLAAIAYIVIYFGIVFIGFITFVADSESGNRWVGKILLLICLYLSAFLTGLILTRMKPFFAPIVTVPLGTMAIFAIGGLFVILENAQQGTTPWWAMSVGIVGLVASMGLVSLIGCIVTRKVSNRLPKFSIPLFQLIGPMAVLVCTSCVVGVLHITLSITKMDVDMQRVLGFCLFAMLVIGAGTIANLVSLFVRSYRNSESPRIGLPNPSEEPVALP